MPYNHISDKLRDENAGDAAADLRYGHQKATSLIDDLHLHMLLYSHATVLGIDYKTIQQ